MDESALRSALEPLIGGELARDMVRNFLSMRRDLATKTLERSSPGKFVETFVQVLQYMATGAYDQKPAVDDYLASRAESAAAVPDGLRICGARIARSIYTLRNKRSIAHKNEVDPNTFDLKFVHEGAAWIMAELIRTMTGLTMQQAGALIDLVQTPVDFLVEEIDGTRLVHANLPIHGEILVLLHSQHPKSVPVKDILDSLRARSSGSVRNKLSEMRYGKLINGDLKSGYRLTISGHAAAVAEIRTLAA